MAGLTLLTSFIQLPCSAYPIPQTARIPLSDFTFDRATTGAVYFASMDSAASGGIGNARLAAPPDLTIPVVNPTPQPGPLVGVMDKDEATITLVFHTPNPIPIRNAMAIMRIGKQEFLPADVPGDAKRLILRLTPAQFASLSDGDPIIFYHNPGYPQEERYFGTLDKRTLTIEDHLQATRLHITNELTALRGSVRNVQHTQALDEAITHLNRAQAPELWADQTHLDAQRGGLVFEAEQSALAALARITQDEDASSPRVRARGLIGRLLLVDRGIAEAALDDAIAAGGDPPLIKSARDAIDRGDRVALDRDLATAITHYRNAWSYGLQAARKP